MRHSNSIPPIRRFFRLLKPEKREITWIYSYAVFNGLVNLSIPLGIQAIINLIQGGRVSTSWIVLVVFVMLGIALTGILQILQLRHTENIQQRIFVRTSFEFAYRLPRIKLENLYKYFPPELVNRFFDTVSVQKGLSKILLDFSTATLQIIFGLILLSLYHPFFIIFSFLLVLLVVLIFRLTASRGLATSLTESKYKYEVGHWLEELARTMNSFKLVGKSELPMERNDKIVNKYLDARESHFRILVGQFSLMVVFKVLVAAGLLIMGGLLVFDQQMNIGQFVAAEIVIIMVMASVEKLILSMETIYDVLTSLDKMGQVTDLDLEKDEGEELLTGTPENGLSVSVNDLTYKYPEANKEVLRGLSLEIKEGEKVCITGYNASGKATLLHLLAALYSDYDGSISYNQLPMRNFKLENLRSQIGTALVQEELFEGTVKENITVGRSDIDMETIKSLNKKLGLDEFIQSLPRGLNTLIDPQGRKLSRSIKRKLIMARALAGKPRLVLLEDIFEHLEQRYREAIMDLLTAPDFRPTVVGISNDLYFMRRCDKVIVLKEGQIAAAGKYEKVKEHQWFKENAQHL